MKKIKIAHLYYDLMNLYGENGNVRYLVDKLEKQGFDVTLYFLTVDDKIDFNEYDFYYMGTGSEDNKKIVLQDIIKHKDDIREAIDKGKFFLITGNSIDLFGKHIEELNGEIIETLNVFDYSVKEEDFRIVGEQFYRVPFIDYKVIGFQNRNSVINGYEKPLFDIVKGTGYKPNDKKEGILKKHFWGTYLLGPILVRNPYLTDYLVEEICKYLDIPYKEMANDVSYRAYHEYLKNFDIDEI